MSNPLIQLPPGVRLLHPDSVPERNGVAATWSHVTRDGEWTLPRHFRALAIMGAVDLDLTTVILGEGESVIEAVAVMGSVTIVVPHGIRVECEGDSTLGTFEIKRDRRDSPPQGAPVIRITGSAFLGSVEVKVVDPNAPGWVDRFLGRERGS